MIDRTIEDKPKQSHLEKLNKSLSDFTLVKMRLQELSDKISLSPSVDIAESDTKKGKEHSLAEIIARLPEYVEDECKQMYGVIDEIENKLLLD